MKDLLVLIYCIPGIQQFLWNAPLMWTNNVTRHSGVRLLAFNYS